MGKDATLDLGLPIVVSFPDAPLLFLPSEDYDITRSYDNWPSLQSCLETRQYPMVERDCSEGTVCAYKEGKFWEVNGSDELEAVASIADTAWQPSQ
jgi:hypothetical protein